VVFFISCASLAATGEKPEDALPIRGFCIGAPGAKSLDSFLNFIEKELAPRQVNTLVLRVDYRYEYQKHPELRENDPLSSEAVKKLAEVCARTRIKLIPHINLLGHQSWAANTGALLRQYPEFDETPNVKMPAKYQWPNPDKLYCKSYCPLHPKVHQVVFDLVDELCSAFGADTFHAGMDEVFYIGEDQCPRCSGHDKAELFAAELRAIHEHLAAKNRRLWIWGDRLLDGKTTGLGMWEASYNSTWRAIDLIPKDVVICDWHYERPDQTPVYFAMKGFQVITCAYRRPMVTTLQTGDMFRFRNSATKEMKERFQGIMQTVWSDAGRFLSSDYQGKSSGRDSTNNAWLSFQAMCDEMNRKE